MAIDFLYTEIGRGHPFYLDGIRECLPAAAVGQVNSVFDCSHGISLLGWRMARSAYRLGSSTAGGGLYSRVRGTQKRAQNSKLMALLVRDVRSRYGVGDTALVVAHPLLANALSRRASLYYQHGELVAPAESLLTGQHHVCVPTDAVADAFLGAGLPHGQIIVTGLCIEDALQQQSARLFSERMSRFKTGGPLTLALYSSGAEPLPHVRQLLDCARVLLGRGDRVIAFCRIKGRFHRQLERRLGVPNATTRDGLTLVPYCDRPTLHAKTLEHFPAFDAFVAPSHERSNWALGLGLPLFMTGPAIGTFAPLNRDLLLKSGVACGLPEEIDSEWGQALHRDGMLAEMSEKGWGQHDISGFRTIAECLQA